MRNIRKTIRKTAVAALLAGSLAGTSALGGMTAFAATAGTADTETTENSKSRLNSAERPEKPQGMPGSRASGDPKGQTENQMPEKPEGEAQQNRTIGKITAISGSVLTVEVMKGQERKAAPEGEQKAAPEGEQKEAPEGKQAGTEKEDQQTDSAAGKLTPPEKPEEKKSESSETMTAETMTTETVTVTVEDASAYAVGDMVEITCNDSGEVSGVAKAEAPRKTDGQQKEAFGNTPGKASENTTEQAAA